MVFFEVPLFERLREDYLDDDQYLLLQATLMARPDAGVIIPGSGGVRKLRWAAKGTGKRGGLRVIYYWIAREDQIALLTVYHKSEVTDLSRDEIRALRELVKTF